MTPKASWSGCTTWKTHARTSGNASCPKVLAAGIYRIPAIQSCLHLQAADGPIGPIRPARLEEDFQCTQPSSPSTPNMHSVSAYANCPSCLPVQIHNRTAVRLWETGQSLLGWFALRPLPPIASAPSVFLIHHMLSIFSPQPLDTLETMLPFDPPLKRHESVVRTQPSPRAAPMRFHPHYRLIPAVRCGAFNRRISEHEGDGWP